MIGLAEFARLVLEMRRHQRAYWDLSHRCPDALARATAAEVKVDLALRDILGVPGLWDPPHDPEAGEFTPECMPGAG